MGVSLYFFGKDGVFGSFLSPSRSMRVHLEPHVKILQVVPSRMEAVSDLGSSLGLSRGFFKGDFYFSRLLFGKSKSSVHLQHKGLDKVFHSYRLALHRNPCGFSFCKSFSVVA